MFKRIKGVLIFFAVLFLVAYCYIQMKTIFDSAITTEATNIYNAQIKNVTECYIFRNETVINADVDGVFNYLVGEGDKLSHNQEIAEVYSSKQDLEINDRINELNERIEVLDNSSIKKRYLKTSISKLDSEIGEYISLFHVCEANGDYSLAVQNRNDFLTLLNKRALVVSSEDGYDELKKDLELEKESLSSSLSNPTSKVKSPASGHFYSSVDGYENLFTVDSISDLTVDSYYDLIENSTPEDTTHTVGKLVTDFEWYTLCTVSKDESVFYNSGEYYKLSYPYSGDIAINCLLKSKITQADRDDVVLVFQTNVIPEGFNFIRRQSVQIIREEQTGLKISKESLRIVDGYEGVYILLENVIRFKRCDIICEYEDYYIVSTTDPLKNAENIEYGYLQMYDVVIVSGKELFDGKMVG